MLVSTIVDTIISSRSPSICLLTTTIVFIVKSMSEVDNEFPLFVPELDQAKVGWKEVAVEELFVAGRPGLGYLPECNLGCRA
jgi:hypothetical protein